MTNQLTTHTPHSIMTILDKAIYHLGFEIYISQQNDISFMIQVQRGLVGSQTLRDEQLDPELHHLVVEKHHLAVDIVKEELTKMGLYPFQPRGMFHYSTMLAIIPE